MEEVREGFLEEESSKQRLKPLGREADKPLEGMGAMSGLCGWERRPRAPGRDRNPGARRGRRPLLGKSSDSSRSFHESCLWFPRVLSTI